jgi:Zinc finger, ZZ type
MCVSCSNYKLCEKCFEVGVHKQHNYFLVKEKVADVWQPTMARINNTVTLDVDLITKNPFTGHLENDQTFNWTGIGTQ